MIFGYGRGWVEHTSMTYIDGPSCVVLYCPICNKIIDKSIHGRKITCSDECAELYQRQVWNRQYADKMAKNPDFAQKQSAKQYARIKADPEKMEARRISQHERMQQPNYKESTQKSQAKYRAKPEVKEKIAKRMRKYRDENIELIADIEARRSQKRSAEREQLRAEYPEKFALLQQAERAASHTRNAEKRLAELQKNLEKLVNPDE